MVLLAAPLVLKVDAFLVATLTGAERTGNVVKFIVSGGAEAVQGIQIWPGCSSVGNISHAALAWVALTQTLGRDLETKDVFWCGLAMILAASVNLARLCMTAVSFEYYAIFHGPLGEQIAGILTIFLIASVCIFGQRRELFART
jgi:exosortase/archaeosortase family protein